MSLDVPEFQKNAWIIFMMPQVHSIDWNYNNETLTSQKAIFEALKQVVFESWVKDFFVEWVTENVSWDELYNIPQAPQVRKIFSDKNKKDIQERLLAQLGAYRVFCILYKWNFKIHSTASNIQLKNISSKINNSWISWACEDLTWSLEYSAEASIRDFRKQNPWKNIAFIFGEWHDFSDNFWDMWEKYYLVKIKQDLNYLFKQVKDCKK